MLGAVIRGLDGVEKIVAAHTDGTGHTDDGNGTGHVDTDGGLTDEIMSAMALDDHDRPDRLDGLDDDLHRAADEARAAGHCDPLPPPTFQAAHAACDGDGGGLDDSTLEPSPTAPGGTVMDLYRRYTAAQWSLAQSDLSRDPIGANVSRKAAGEALRRLAEAVATYPGVVRVGAWHGLEVPGGSMSIRDVALVPSLVATADGRPIAAADDLPWPSAVDPAFGRVKVKGGAA